MKTHEFVFEAEFAFPSPAELAGVTKTLQKHPEQALVECDRAVLVGVGERGPVGPFRNTEMFELAQAAGQAPADFPERIRMGGWQNSMATNCVQQLNPLALYSAWCSLTSLWNSERGIC